jgi:hypothetical protein
MVASGLPWIDNKRGARIQSGISATHRETGRDRRSYIMVIKSFRGLGLGATAGLSSSASSGNPARRGTGKAGSFTQQIILRSGMADEQDRTS